MTKTLYNLKGPIRAVIIYYYQFVIPGSKLSVYIEYERYDIVFFIISREDNGYVRHNYLIRLFSVWQI